MSSQNALRATVSSFIVVLIFVAASGWRWTGSHQPPPQAAASRVVLTLCIVSGVAGLGALWRPRPPR